MSKRRPAAALPPSARPTREKAIRRATATSGPASGDGRTRLFSGPAGWLALVAGLGAVILVAAFALGFFGRPAANAQTGANPDGVTVQANGGTWTNITPDRLATMLESKDFTLLNVKTPYVGEIARTDLYIPYDQVSARASELPSDKSAKLVVYCRSGHESAIAAQTLIDLGYTNIDNLDGGMEAWTASGRQLVNLNRTGG